MNEVKINTSKTLTLTLPSDPASNTVSVSLYHEFGDLVSGPTNATRTGAGVYTITYGQQASGVYVLNSAGKHRADFKYTISGTEYTQSQYINVYTPYTTSSDFFSIYPDLQTDYGTVFDSMEKKARYIINTFCGQSFEYYPNKKIIINGSNNKTLRLPIPVSTLSSVIQDEGKQDETILLSDTTSYVEKIRNPLNFNSTYGLKFSGSNLDSPSYQSMYSRFREASSYSITGDWGWSYVPDNVAQAAIILIADMTNNDSEYRNHGINRIEMDAIKIHFNPKFYESTGNIEADILLMDYTLFLMDYVI